MNAGSLLIILNAIDRYEVGATRYEEQSFIITVIPIDYLIEYAGKI
jgi:hypothetical protein